MSFKFGNVSNFVLNTKKALLNRDKFFFLRKKRSIVGQIHINRTGSNIFLSLTDLKGKIITTTSSGFVGFSKKKKLSPQAAYVAALHLKEVARKMNIFNVDIILHVRVNIFVYSVLRALKSSDSIYNNHLKPEDLPGGKPDFKGPASDKLKYEYFKSNYTKYQNLKIKGADLKEFNFKINVRLFYSKVSVPHNGMRGKHLRRK